MVAIGVLVGEVWHFSMYLGWNLSNFISSSEYSVSLLWTIFWSCGAVLSLAVLVYPFVRGSIADFIKIIRSFRVDLLIMFGLGFTASVLLGGVITPLYETGIATLNPMVLVFLVSLPIVMVLAVLIRALQIKFITRTLHKPFFISDREGEKKERDLLNYASLAVSFAERVCNGDSKESVVFGIDAPWGIGKSTFVNYCTETWKEKQYAEKIAVYRFSPLRYEDRGSLLEKFIDGFVATIQKSAFTPEIRPLISKYSRLIKAKSTFSFLGFEVELPSSAYTVDDAFCDLEVALKESSKKIIVVVDDLDRLAFSEIKDVLYAIKKSFTLSNVSYVLCYDTENIGVFDEKNSEAEKIREFLEKFVNVKITLFADSDMLEKFISDSGKTVLGVEEWLYQSNTQLALQGLREILQSPDYHNYVPYIGDLRKIKRYINILKLFELEKLDHENSDLNSRDLTHLLLIYINYPNIFRKIYNSETLNRRGFFSVVIKYDDYYPEDENPQQGRNSTKDNDFKNSTLYADYMKNGNLTKEQKFLLEKVFTVSKRLETTVIDNVTPDIKSTYALFNGGSPWSGGRNLDEYLNVIVKGKKLERGSQYRFYLNAREEIKKGTPIEDVLSKEEFAVSKGESAHKQFWQIIIDGARDLDPKIGSNVITYLLNHGQDYSFFTNEKIGVGLRDDLDYSLVKLLDSIGWSDPIGERGANTEENIKEIAEWVFGEGRHANSGVLETLSKKDRGVVGLYDLMAFRLFCSADRGGDIFNLTRAIAKHGDPKAPTEGSTRDIAVEEMREMSQRVFATFKEQYITPKKNLFAEIEKVTLADLAGKYLEYIEEQVRLGKITEEERDTYISSLKSRMKAFITFQLGNTMISHGVGCGYYDEVGTADGKGIAQAMNDYLFEVCCNPKIDTSNYEHFLDYLLINFASIFGSRKGRNYIPHIDEFTKVLDSERLASYWRTHSEAIKALNLETKKKAIHTGNYIATYEEDLKDVFEVLDTLIQKPDLGKSTTTKDETLELPPATEE